MELTPRRVVAVATELLEGGDLDDILRRVLEAGREFTGARYAALGVLDERRAGLARFLTAGLDAEQVDRMGELPRGHGVLGELIRHPKPLRLARVSSHPRSYGFPVGHPPMDSFLGAPIVIRGTVYGNLYLTEKEGGGDFTEQDEEHLVLLAECAAIAIHQTQRFEELESRRDELEQAVTALSATNEIHRALGGETDLQTVLELVAKRARALVVARTLVILLAEGEYLRVADVAGERPESLERGSRIGEGSIAAEIMHNGVPQRLDNELKRARFYQHGLGRYGVTAEAGLFVPLRLRGRNLGVLAALDRLEGGPDFSHEDEEMLSSFAIAAATAVYTAQTVGAERLRERDAAAENERRRWARELHDETLQGLAAIRVALASARDDDDDSVRRANEQAIRDLQSELDRLRAIIQDVRPSSLDDLGLVAALEALVARHGGHGAPALHLRADLAQDDGPRLDPEVETGLYRIAQEALTNALKHADPSLVEIAVAELEGEIGLRIRDDGAGFDVAAATTGLGLVGMRERVDLLGGRLTISSAAGRGTTVEARLPIRRLEPDAALAR